MANQNIVDLFTIQEWHQEKKRKERLLFIERLHRHQQCFEKVTFPGHRLPLSYIPFNNRLQGPYCKLITNLAFSLRYMVQARGAQAINRRRKTKRGSAICSTDREDEVGKIVILGAFLWGVPDLDQ